MDKNVGEKNFFENVLENEDESYEDGKDLTVCRQGMYWYSMCKKGRLELGHNFKKAKKIYEDLEDNLYLAMTLINLGEAYYFSKETVFHNIRKINYNVFFFFLTLKRHLLK